LTGRRESEPPLEIRIADPARARADARARRQRWLNVLLLLIVAPAVVAMWFRLSPMLSAPVRILLKMSVFLLPLLFVLVILVRLRRR